MIRKHFTTHGLACTVRGVDGKFSFKLRDGDKVLYATKDYTTNMAVAIADAHRTAQRLTTAFAI